MNVNIDRRLIEDYLPIEDISVEASSEPRTKGHISTMHIWRARRPLLACRAAIYAALVPDSQFAHSQREGRKQEDERAEVRKFIKALCQYPGSQLVVAEASNHILNSQASRLSMEANASITVEDILAGRAPRPRVLDMFAGGGAIPLESARLGCETFAVELNPVAYLIELCTVTFPQQFGPALASDVENWARKVLDETAKQVSDLFGSISRPHKRRESQQSLSYRESKTTKDEGLSVFVYYWTRTAPCPKPICRATVPLYRQTWLRRKGSGFIALKPELGRQKMRVRFRVVEASSEAALGFDPAEGSESSSTVCPFCKSTLEGDYVRNYGESNGFGQQLMCAVALNPDGAGKLYITDETVADRETETQMIAEERALRIEKELGNSSLDEVIPPTGNAGLATGNSYMYGILTFRQMFTSRQRLTLLTMAREIRRAHDLMLSEGVSAERAKAITTYLGLWLSRLTDRFNSLCRWENTSEKIQGLTSLKRFAMMWDFPEVNIFGGASGDAWGNLSYITEVIKQEGAYRLPTKCIRGSATDLTFDTGFFDAVITDPPYYDNESYSELSDVCYVWLRPTVGFLYPEHFASLLTPKKKECVAAAYRQGGKMAAKKFYEDSLFHSLQQAHRVTKPTGILVLVYAHKTTLGWSTLVDAIRRADYEVTEAWPLDTETKARVAHQGDAALASSIFLVARKRHGATIGKYEEVRPELGRIVQERVSALWDMGISGPDLLIASVGAGLRAFTRYASVEYANGDQVPAERFLAEVETVVLDAMMAKLSAAVGTSEGRYSLVGVDPPSRFYVLWRYTYRAEELEAGEAIIFANGTHVELEGPQGLSSGSNPLLQKKTSKNKSRYRLLDYGERGDDSKLGISSADGQPASLVDVLHRLLWLMERHPSGIGDFLTKANCNTDQLRIVAQALARPALKGSTVGEIATGTELASLTKLTANWRSVVDEEGPLFKAAAKRE